MTNRTMKYTKEIIFQKCDAAMEKVHLFYTFDFINYRGKCADTGELYSEVIAQYISEHLDRFMDGIETITRDGSYQTNTHLGEFDQNSRRVEELTAMKMFNFCKDGGQYDHIGKIIDYQTPLKNKSSDAAGKIDLLAYDGTCLRLLELKKPDSTETMLRCVMEGFTYLKTVNRQKLLRDFKIPADKRMEACPLVFTGKQSNPYQEMREDRPQLKRLMKLLDCTPYYIQETDGVYTIIDHIEIVEPRSLSVQTKTTMITKSKFDQFIKKNLISLEGEHSFGYQLDKTYENYYTKESFRLFVDEMQAPRYRAYFNSYDCGKGSELKEQSGRYGVTPPKMASVASSSLFCYLALRDGAEGMGGSGTVEFEHECRIAGISGTAPQLDAFIPNENIFVEAKCHEIFDKHHVVLRSKYWEYIYGEENGFGFSTDDTCEGDQFEIPLKDFGIAKSSAMFDIKQLLCHLLGIVSQKDAAKPATLIYLFFFPKMTQQEERTEIDKVRVALQTEIETIFNSKPIATFIKKNHIHLKALAEYAPTMEKLTKNNVIEMFTI